MRPFFFEKKINPRPQSKLFFFFFFFFFSFFFWFCFLQMEYDPFQDDSYEAKREFSRVVDADSMVAVVCWSCGEINADDAVCPSCNAEPLRSEIECSSSGEDEEEVMSKTAVFQLPSSLSASGSRASCSDVPPRKPLPQVGAGRARPVVRSMPSEQTSLDEPTTSPPSLTVVASPPSSGPSSARTPRSSSPVVSPRRHAAITSPRQKKRVVVKTPGGQQVPDFESVKRDTDGSWSGWLYKQKAQGRVNVLDGGWKPRFVQWDPKKARLYYYHYEGEQEFANFVSFDSKTIVQTSSACPDASLAGCAFQVMASYTHRPYVFCCGSPEVERERKEGLRKRKKYFYFLLNRLARSGCRIFLNAFVWLRKWRLEESKRLMMCGLLTRRQRRSVI
jgi:hypothetical protein